MGLAFTASHTSSSSALLRLTSDSGRLLPRRQNALQNALVRVNSASAGASLPAGRVVLSSERPQQQSLRPGTTSATNPAGAGPDARVWNAPTPERANGVATAAAAATTVLPSTQSTTADSPLIPVRSTPRLPKPTFVPVPVPEDVIAEFEQKLEADLQTVGVTLTAILGVIIFWRGVWSLLDHFVGDSVVGDICCVIVGLTIVLYIRLSGMKIASFWPPS